jgi:hypothetical protein
MSLASELTAQMTRLLDTEPFDSKLSKEVGQWFETNFRVNTSFTPRGMKEIKKLGESFRWWLQNSSMYQPEEAKKQLTLMWMGIKPILPELVTGFTEEGGTSIPVELKVGPNTYKNTIGLTEKALLKYVERFEAIFHALKGWRRAALKGGVTVVLAGPTAFRGTAKGVYRSAEDALYVRAIPAVLKRGEGYAGAEYIIVHELGHRWERYNRVPVDFDRSNWWTTKYSQKEGESFAELFALGHYGGTVANAGTWDPLINERFEGVMQGGGDVVDRVASRFLGVQEN